jgi:hypothetical protein
MESLSTERLCSFCGEITLESLFDHDHQPSLEALQQSSKTCPLCRLIYEAIEPVINTVRTDLGQKSPQDANLPISLQGQATQEVASTAYAGKQWHWQNIQISMVQPTFRVPLGEISPYVEDGMLSQAFVPPRAIRVKPLNSLLTASVPFSVHTLEL